MKQIKATKTDRYAQNAPHLPCIPLVEGQVYDLDDYLADRIVELGGAEPVVDEIETPEAQAEPVETKTKPKAKKAKAKAK